MKIDKKLFDKVCSNIESEWQMSFEGVYSDFAEEVLTRYLNSIEVVVITHTKKETIE